MLGPFVLSENYVDDDEKQGISQHNIRNGNLPLLSCR